LKPDYINLENGYYNFIPQPLLEKYIAHIREVNYQGAWYMRNLAVENKKKVTAKLAELVGCSAEEIAITRNTTESLDIVLAGKHWQAGNQTRNLGSDGMACRPARSSMGIISRRRSVRIKSPAIHRVDCYPK
jgi:hypothetical protein